MDYSIWILTGLGAAAIACLINAYFRRGRAKKLIKQILNELDQGRKTV